VAPPRAAPSWRWPTSSAYRCISSASARRSRIWRPSTPRPSHTGSWVSQASGRLDPASYREHLHAMSKKDATPGQQELHSGLKIALDLGPLLLFFFVNAKWGIFAATGTFMAATLFSLGFTYAFARKIPMMPLVSAGVVLVFGGLTIWLQDETFIKIKPTIIYALFAAGLIGGLPFCRPPLTIAFALAQTPLLMRYAIEQKSGS